MTHSNSPTEIILPTFLHESEDASSNHHEARSIEDNDVLGDLRFLTDASSLENVIPQDRMRDALDSYTFFSSRALVQKPQKQVSNNELVSNASSNSSESSADSVATLQTTKIKYHKRFSGVKQRAAAAIYLPLGAANP